MKVLVFGTKGSCPYQIVTQSSIIEVALYKVLLLQMSKPLIHDKKSECHMYLRKNFVEALCRLSVQTQNKHRAFYTHVPVKKQTLHTVTQ